MRLFDRLKHKLMSPQARVRASGRAWAARLRNYAPYEAPHPGPSMNWTLAQAQENLAYLLAQREARLAQLDGLLAEAGIAIAPALAGQPPDVLLDQLYAWRVAEWPGLRASVPDVDIPLASRITTRGQAHIAYSVVMDLAILLGEIILRWRQAPAVAWAVDEEGRWVDIEVQARPLVDGVHSDSWKRPVVLVRMPQPSRLLDAALDVEGLVLDSLRHAQTLRDRDDHWGRVVCDAVRGAYEPVR